MNYRFRKTLSLLCAASMMLNMMPAASFAGEIIAPVMDEELSQYLASSQQDTPVYYSSYPVDEGANQEPVDKAGSEALLQINLSNPGVAPSQTDAILAPVIAPDEGAVDGSGSAGNGTQRETKVDATMSVDSDKTITLKANKVYKIRLNVKDTDTLHFTLTGGNAWLAAIAEEDLAVTEDLVRFHADKATGEVKLDVAAAPGPYIVAIGAKDEDVTLNLNVVAHKTYMKEQEKANASTETPTASENADAPADPVPSEDIPQDAPVIELPASEPETPVTPAAEPEQVDEPVADIPADQPAQDVPADPAISTDMEGDATVDTPVSDAPVADAPVVDEPVSDAVPENSDPETSSETGSDPVLAPEQGTYTDNEDIVSEGYDESNPSTGVDQNTTPSGTNAPAQTEVSGQAGSPSASDPLPDVVAGTPIAPATEGTEETGSNAPGGETVVHRDPVPADQAEDELKRLLGIDDSNNASDANPDVTPSVDAPSGDLSQDDNGEHDSTETPGTSSDVLQDTVVDGDVSVSGGENVNKDGDLTADDGADDGNDDPETVTPADDENQENNVPGDPADGGDDFVSEDEPVSGEMNTGNEDGPSDPDEIPTSNTSLTDEEGSENGDNSAADAGDEPTDEKNTDDPSAENGDKDPEDAGDVEDNADSEEEQPESEDGTEDEDEPAGEEGNSEDGAEGEDAAEGEGDGETGKEGEEESPEDGEKSEDTEGAEDGDGSEEKTGDSEEGENPEEGDLDPLTDFVTRLTAANVSVMSMNLPENASVSMFTLSGSAVAELVAKFIDAGYTAPASMLSDEEVTDEPVATGEETPAEGVETESPEEIRVDPEVIQIAPMRRMSLMQAALPSEEGEEADTVSEEEFVAEIEAQFQDVIVEKVPGPEKTGHTTGYVGFDVSVSLPEGEALEDGIYSVSVDLPNSVSITGELPEGAQVRSVDYTIYHIHDGVEEIPLDSSAVVLNENNEISSVSFETSNFSSFILQYTVEFTYTDPVTQYTCPEFTLQGGNSVMLSELLDTFGLTVSLKNASLNFTNPSLVGFTQVTNEAGEVVDYKVTALQPFTSTETLVITLESGDRIVLTVTDAISTAVLLSFAAKLRSGATLNGDNDLVWTADSIGNHMFKYRVTYNVTNFVPWNPNEIQIVIPKSILWDTSGNRADEFAITLPEEHDEEMTDENVFAYREDGDNLVIFNRIAADPAQAGYFEIGYVMNKPIFEYADYLSEAGVNAKGGSDPLTATINLYQNNAVSKTRTMTVDPVYIDTSSQLTYLYKRNAGSVNTWSTAWGEAPADASQYTYLTWVIESHTTGTQPYNLSFEDLFSPENGEVVAIRLSGETAYTPGSTAVAQNIKQVYESNLRYDYVVTRQLKSTIEQKLEDNLNYDVTNQINVTLHPAHNVDADSSLTATQDYRYTRKLFIPPGGYVWAEKYGYTYNNNQAYQSYEANARNYQLNELISGEISSIPNLKWSVLSYGYTYPWTLPVGASANDPSVYGLHAVTMEVEDHELYLRAIEGDFTDRKLTVDDYELTALQLSFFAMDATYSADEMKFITYPGNYTDDVIHLYLEYNGSYVDVGTYAVGMGTFNVNSAYVTSTSGSTMNLAPGCTGYLLRTDNRHYYSSLTAYPYATLKNSEYVLNIARSSETPKIEVRNVSDTRFYKGTVEDVSDSTRFTTMNRLGSCFIVGIARHGYVDKVVRGYSNNVREKNYTVSWQVEAGEDYLINGNYEYVPQSGGVIYDLLPPGTDFSTSSLKVFANTTELTYGQYSTEIIQNYHGSGQTMVIVRIEDPTDKYYRLTYKTVHTWDSIKDYGDTGLNSVAYETGNYEIGDGRPDDGGTLTHSDIMAGLSDEDMTGRKKFLYTQTQYHIDALTAASIGLYKRVKAADEENYSSQTTVYPASAYSYKIRFTTSDESSSRDMVLYDSLENYTIERGSNVGKTSDWHGILDSVDMSQLETLGIAPVLYYSTAANLDIPTHMDLTDSSTWTPASSYAGAKADIKAIAVDMSKDTQGNDYELQPDSSGTVIVYMTSPEAANAPQPVNGQIPVALNNIYMYGTVRNVSTNTSYSELMHQEYTTVRYKVMGDLDLIKISSAQTAEADDTLDLTAFGDGYHQLLSGMKFRLWGTSDYGTQVDMTVVSNTNGRLIFPKLELGTYNLQELDSNLDYFADKNLHTVTINTYGQATLDSTLGALPQGADPGYRVLLRREAGVNRYCFVFENEPRVHAPLRFVKRGNIDGMLSTRLLGGVEFELTGKSDYGNDIALYATSNQFSGLVTFDVEMGTYELKEIATADGYIVSTTVYTVICDSDGIVSLYFPPADAGT